MRPSDAAAPRLQPVLFGEFVTLRAIAPDDFDALFALESDLTTWELRNATPPAPWERSAWEEHTRARLSGNDGAVRFAVEAGGSFVGSCLLTGVDDLARHADVGISLAADARGRGLGTEALRLLARFAFTRHNLHRLQLEVLARNDAAVACYRKVGFVEEGRRRQHAWVDGRYEDDLIMGLLRDEWMDSEAGSKPQ
ncbi:MAG: family N-acetyltransferase [Solirubrobacterales bacterium]|nr:family N-acetyltransferase [Solirubrobacterales bacterium]